MFVAAAFLALQVQPPYTVQTIFTHDVTGAECSKVNDNSQVLCYIDPLDRPMPFRGFIWENGQFTEIPAPQSHDPNDRVSVVPSDVNNNGEVIGMIQGGSAIWNRYTYFFQWSKGYGMRQLKVDEKQFWPYSINNEDEILGFRLEDGGMDTAGILKPSGFTELFPAQRDWSPAYVLTDHDVVGGMQGNASTQESWSYVLPSGSHDFTKLSLPPYVPNPDPARNPVAVLTGINNAGWMVGDVNMNSMHSDWLANHLAAVWSPDNTFYSLGAGYEAKSINDKGVVVGAQMELMMGHFPRPHRAFIYDSTHGMRFLDSMVPYGSPDLTDAVSINNKGEIVCHGPENDWYLLTPTN